MKAPEQASSGGVAINAFVHLLVSQVLTRVMGFGLNLLIARQLTPEAYGLAAIQFHLLNTTILFLAREGFRRGCLRVDSADPAYLSKVLGTALITVPVGGLMAAGVSVFLLHTTTSTDEAYITAISIQGLAAFIEILSEPLYIVAMAQLQYKIRVYAETSATIAKSSMTLFLLSVQSPPALAFAWGQVAYAGATLACYVAHLVFNLGSFTNIKPAPDRTALRLSGVFSLQAGGKLLLAEGSKAVLATTSKQGEQGVYGLVTNLGSLVVRTVFQPFEEAAYAAFAKSASDKGKPALKRKAELLSLLCRAIYLLGLIAAAYGPAYAYIVLLVLYGRRWAESGAPLVLAVYSGYIAFLAMNGVMEAFVHAVADEHNLHRANAALLVISLIHIAASVMGVVKAGAIGLVIADSINMALRIGYCLYFSKRHFALVARFGVADLVPTRKTLMMLVFVFIVTNTSQIMLLPDSPVIGNEFYKQWQVAAAWPAAVRDLGTFNMRAMAHVGVGMACLVLTAGSVYINERGMISDLKNMRRKGTKMA